jgi:hypothetical protein
MLIRNLACASAGSAQAASALSIELVMLAAAGEDMKKLREIARVYIARCEAGDMQAIKELANRLDCRPAMPKPLPPAGPITSNPHRRGLMHASRARPQRQKSLNR